jgi:hypothetical protein
MATVGEIIQLARDEDVSFTREAHTNRALVSRVKAYQKELLGRAVVAAPDFFAQPLEIPLPIPETGYELLEDETESDPVPLEWTVIQPRGEAVKSETEKWEVEVVARQAQWGPHRTAPVWVIGNRVYAGNNPAFWRSFQFIRLFYVPAAPEEVTEEDTLIFGPRAESVFVAYLAWFMAKRRPREIGRSIDMFEVFWREQEREFLFDLMGRSPKTDRVREVW